MSVAPSTLDPDRWDVTAAQHVGIVFAGDCEVRIRPKVAVERLFFLLGYAADSTGWHQDAADFGEADDLVSAMVHGFLHQTDRAFSQGILQGYRRVEEAIPAVRGRIREADQVRRRFGLALPVEVAYDDFTTDIAENLLIRSAAARLRQLRDLDDRSRHRLARLDAVLEGVSYLIPGHRPPEIRFSRLNDRYRGATTLARLILDNLSVELHRGGHTAVSFLFDMNKVFEDFVTAALTVEFGRLGLRVTPQWRGYLDEAGRVTIKPDLTWWSAGRCRGVADIKYKSLYKADMPNADAYQALAYCTALDLPTGQLIYAAGNEEPATHQVLNAGTRIEVTALDLDQPPKDLLGHIARLAAQVAASAAPVAVRPLLSAGAERW
ncbi:MAG: hypothetical protein JNK12_05430 [Acidimicrobiales bacterium]|nr:hypothetical protein [Acidimicrobiales bacterium]